MVATLASGLLLMGGALAGVAAAHVAELQYHFRTLNNNNDPAFNQLLGINNSGVIGGYFGSGAQGQSNKGYLLFPHYRPDDYLNENFPGSAQTQVTGLNDRSVTVGFWLDMNNANLVNDNFGFYRLGGGRFHSVNFPANSNPTPPTNQLLGVNNRDLAVGFYIDAAGNDRGYVYSIRRRRFHKITIPGATNVTAARSTTAMTSPALRPTLPETSTGTCCAATASSPPSTSRAQPRPRRSASTTTARWSAPTWTAPAAPRRPTGSRGPRCAASRPSVTPTESARQPSTESTTRLSWSASTPMPPGTPTAWSPIRPISQ